MHLLSTWTLVRAALFPVVLAVSANAQVVHWRLVKGPAYLQQSSAPAPTFLHWHVYSVVETTGSQDFAQLAVSGGGVAGALHYEQDAPGIFTLEREYASQAAMNAEFPSATNYTLHGSGGTLGSITQAFSLAAETYPPTPALTSSTFAAMQQYPASAPFTFQFFTGPGATYSSALSLFTRSDDDVYSALLGSVNSATVPAGTVAPDDCYFVDVEFQNTVLIQAGGFGVGGDTSHNTITSAYFASYATATSGPCASSEAVGTGCEGMALAAGPPATGAAWDVSTTGVSALGLVVVLFSSDALEPELPLSLLGIPAPGCSTSVDASGMISSISGVAAGGQFSFAVNLPSSSALWGAELALQSVGLTTANAAGIATSNGLLAFVGAR